MAKDGETRATVLVALGANLVIAAAKAVGGLISGSPALLSEGAHSVADSLNEVFLLASLSRSRRRADSRHPFGYRDPSQCSGLQPGGEAIVRSVLTCALEWTVLLLDVLTEDRRRGTADGPGELRSVHSLFARW